MKKLIMPFIAKLLSSDALLNGKRQVAELKRKLIKAPHHVDIYIAVNDPYSYLLMQVLPELIARFGLQIRILTILDRQADMYPDLEKWHQNSLVDARRLAHLYQLDLPETDPDFSNLRIKQFSHKLIHAEKLSNSVTDVTRHLKCFWHNKPMIDGECHSLSEQDFANQQLVFNQQHLKKHGHYFSAMMHYQGEWYWGLDRLGYLERRLISLNPDVSKDIKYDLQYRDFCQLGPAMQPSADPLALEIYFSARSPYSYLGLEQANQLAEHYNIPLVIKPVLPMMMRNVNVPQAKKMYIFHDTKREAKMRGFPYGFVADPLGLAVENCYGLYIYAKQQGKEREFLLAFSRAVNAQGIRADKPKGLQKIIETAGLDWQQAQHFVENQQWRKMVEDNFAELTKLGLWGVPSFRYGDTVVWGQDRMWVIERAIVEHQTKQNECNID